MVCVSCRVVQGRSEARKDQKTSEPRRILIVAAHVFLPPGLDCRICGRLAPVRGCRFVLRTHHRTGDHRTVPPAGDVTRSAFVPVDPSRRASRASFVRSSTRTPTPCATSRADSDSSIQNQMRNATRHEAAKRRSRSASGFVSAVENPLVALAAPGGRRTIDDIREARVKAFGCQIP